MKKKLSSLLFVILVLMAVAIPAQASTVMPRYTHVLFFSAYLEIDTVWGIATCEGELTARNELPVKIIVDLQRYIDGSWVTIKSWEAEDIKNVSIIKEYAISRGYNYRARVRGYVYDENGTIVEATSKNYYQEFYN